jgi:hypothetical protein
MNRFSITIALLLVPCTVCFARNPKWNNHYYIMNTVDTRELSVGNHSSSDEKVAAVKNNRIHLHTLEFLFPTNTQKKMTKT